MEVVHTYLLTPLGAQDGDAERKGIDKDGLFSPMNCSNSSDASLQLGSALTPKRRLSMDLDESTQDSTDSGFYRSNSLSSSSSSSELFSQSSQFSLSAGLGAIIESSPRTPLRELSTNSSCGEMKTIPARRARAKRSISFACEQGKDRILSPLTDSLGDLPCRPSSLPSLPCSPLTLDNSSSSSRRPSLVHQISSPLERMTLLSPSQVDPASSQPYSSRLRAQSVDSDGYSEVFDSEEYSENSQPPTLSRGISSLISAPFSQACSSHNGSEKSSGSKPAAHSTPALQVVPTPLRPSFYRSDSWSMSTAQPKQGSLKRASQYPDSSQQMKKKRLPLPVFSSNSQDSTTKHSPLKGVQLLRSQSYSMGSGEHFFYPVSPGSDNGNMIGDFSKTYALPLVKSRIEDLKCISPHTLAGLLTDPAASSIDDYCILDCRYPYEYEGGHIRGAQNVWEKDTLLNQFFKQPTFPADGSRKAIIFHCEFSSKRGPDMSRFMRRTDREKNGMSFPKLYYPELYLLEGGYKAFYEQHSELCEPQCYVQMLDDQHKEALKHFKYRSKSWNGGERPPSKRRGAQLRPRRSTVDSTTHHMIPSSLTSNIPAHKS